MMRKFRYEKSRDFVSAEFSVKTKSREPHGAITDLSPLGSVLFTNARPTEVILWSTSCRLVSPYCMSRMHQGANRVYGNGGCYVAQRGCVTLREVHITHCVFPGVRSQGRGVRSENSKRQTTRTKKTEKRQKEKRPRRSKCYTQESDKEFGAGQTVTPSRLNKEAKDVWGGRQAISDCGFWIEDWTRRARA